MKMVTHRHGSQLSIVTTTVLICALFALPMICSAMPSSGDESVSTERQGVPQYETKVLGEDLDTTEKQPTIQVKEEESMATSEKQKRHSQRTLRIREVIFRRLVRRVIRKDPTLSALFLRLVFHDAYTVDPKTGKGGCNGSIRQELKRVANTGLDKAIRILTPFQRRSRLSWGDVTAVAGAEAVEAAGGPKIRLRLGRRESNGEDPAGILPSPRSNVQTLQASFKSRGFSDLDIASLSGGHTLGKGFGVPFCKHQNTFSNEYVPFYPPLPARFV